MLANTSLQGDLTVNGNTTLNQLSINQNLSSPLLVTTRIIGADTNGIHFGDSSVVLAYPSPSHANLSGNQISYDNVYSNLGQGRLAIGFAYALGNPSLAFGTNAASPTKANGNNSIAFGMGGTESDAVGSIAFGFNVKAGVNATKSIVIGSGIGISTTTALIHNTANSLAVGFNSDAPTLFVGGGNGTHNSIGKVGIGTTTPGAMLDITTTIASTGSSLLKVQNATLPNPNSTTYYQTLFEVKDNGQTFVGVQRQNTNAAADHQNAILQVSGDMVVGTSGSSAHANIWVTEQNWADFVFDKEYKLMPLNELENFYTTNHHLPNVPTQKDIQEQGNNLAQTDVVLLRKIEENTLYIVELKKQLEAQQKLIEELAKKVADKK